MDRGDAAARRQIVALPYLAGGRYVADAPWDGLTGCRRAECGSSGSPHANRRNYFAWHYGGRVDRLAARDV